MAQNDVTINIKTQVDQSNKAIKSFKETWRDLDNAISGAIGNIEKVGQAIKQELDAYTNQADAVRDLALATQTGYEETSRLIQVMDDAGIQTEQTKTAMIAMNKAGISPTIDNLAKMSDEFRAIQDPAERSAYLIKNLGNRGIEVAKVFEQTGDQIRAAGAAVDESLIFDEAKIKAAEELRIAEDNLSDSITALKNEAIAPLIPALAEAINKFAEFANIQRQDGIPVIKNYVNSANLWVGVLKALIGVQDEAKSGTEEQTGAIEDQTKAIEDHAKATNAQADALRTAIRWQEQGEDVTQRYTDLSLKRTDAIDEEAIRLKTLADAEKDAADKAKKLADDQRWLNSVLAAGEIEKAYKDQIKTVSELTDKHDELQKKKEELIAAGWSPEGEKVKEIDAAMAEVNQQQLDTIASTRALTEELIFQQSTAGLDAEQLLELELATGRISESQYNTAVAVQALGDAFKNKQIDAEKFAEVQKLIADAMADGVVTGGELKAVIDALQSKDITINTNYTSNGQPPAGSGSAYGPGTGGGGRKQTTANPTGPKVNDKIAPGAPPQYAEGTMSAPGGLAIVGEKGPELVDLPRGSAVYSSSDTKNMLGGITIAPGAIVINGGSASAEAIAQQVIVAIERKAEQQRRSGAGRY